MTILTIDRHLWENRTRIVKGDTTSTGTFSSHFLLADSLYFILFYFIFKHLGRK
jgi:hypothetical protein